jgi:uncharacterized BrkB/YihY/UPF0761 family membrane protein
MAPRKKLRKVERNVRKRVNKKQLLGAILIVAFITFGSVLVNYYIFKFNVNPVHAVVVLIFIGGSFAVLSEMRGGMRKRASRVRSRLKRKIKRKKK